jgi:predicted TIM-barrel fold metal-dependent hydrolase
MRQGIRVIDVDTHVNPSLEVLLRYADSELNARLDELKPYTKVVKPRIGQGDPEDREEYSILAINPVRYDRVAGSAPGEKEESGGPIGFLSGRTQMANREPIAIGSGDDNSVGRLKDMDTEGRDIDFIIPGTWAYGAPDLEPSMTRLLYRAYHRFMTDYCSADPRRLKSMIAVSGTDPQEGAQAIREYGKYDWAAAVWPNVPLGMPMDHPDMDPIWEAANELELPIAFHSFTIETPYFPGYRDVWDNAAMGRCAGQTWGGQRFLSFMMMSGILDRYPNLRIGTLESGHGWFPHWILRLTRQIDYVKGSVPDNLKYTPVEYVQQGRVFCSIDFSEGSRMTKAVTDLVGDHVLMYASDYPHPETIFPDHTDTVIGWKEELGDRALNKLMWENSAKFLRLSSTPW